jgi:polyphosphate kinase 2 (PPK2 family)
MQATKRSDSIVIVSGWMSGGQRARERRVLQRRQVPMMDYKLNEPF